MAILAIFNFTKDYLIKQKNNSIQGMGMASTGFLIGGAIINTLAFSRSNVLYNSIS